MKPSTSSANSSSSRLNTPVYFKLTRIVAVVDVVISLTDTIVTALIFFGEEEDVLKSLYYKIIKQRGITVFHPSHQVRWNQTLFSWAALVITTMFNLLWFNASCYLLYGTLNKGVNDDGNGSHRLNYCRSWLLVSGVLLITYSVHIFTNGQECPGSLLASLLALFYRALVICIVYGLLLHLEEKVRRPFFSTVNGVYIHPPTHPHPQKEQQQHQDAVKSFSRPANVNNSQLLLQQQQQQHQQQLQQLQQQKQAQLQEKQQQFHHYPSPTHRQYEQQQHHYQQYSQHQHQHQRQQQQPPQPQRQQYIIHQQQQQQRPQQYQQQHGQIYGFHQI